MVERIALSAVVLVGVLAVFLGTPRYLGDGGGWPNVVERADAAATAWLNRPKWLDIGVGIVAVVFLGIAVSIFRGAAVIEVPEIVGWPLLILGFLGLFAATYVNVRRSGLSSAEAMLIGASLVGAVLLVAVSAVLLQI